MNRLLLLNSPKFTWREWIKSELKSRDLLVLDPMSADYGPPGLTTVFCDGKRRDWRFVGSTDASRNPIGLLRGAAELLPLLSDDSVVLMPESRHTPVSRQTNLALAELVQPTEIHVPRDSDILLEGWPVGPGRVEVEPAFPEMVKTAQRRARWIELLEKSIDHVVEMDNVVIDGARLGQGTPVSPEALERVGAGEVLHAEAFGGLLLVVSRAVLADSVVPRLLDLCGAHKAQIVDPDAYSGRLCSFARQSGEDFGYGVIEQADFARRQFHVRSDAVAPAPVRILRLGTLRIDSQGREVGDDRPWAV